MHGHGLVFAESGELRFGLFLDPVFHRSFFGDKDTNKRAKSQKNFGLFRARVFSSFRLRDTNKRAKSQKNFEFFRARVFSSVKLRDVNYCYEITFLFLLLLKELYIIEYY